jgi:hypothetical protein
LAKVVEDALPQDWKRDTIAELENDPLVIAARRHAESQGIAVDWESLKDAVLRELERLPEFLDVYMDAAMPHVRAALPEFRARINTRFGILSLAEPPDCILMWAHYADAHRGIVLEFDSEHPFFDQRESADDAIRFLRKVTYSSDRPSFTMYDPSVEPRVLLEKLVAAFFLTKAANWSYEREWRMIVPVTQENPDARAIHLFALPPDSITGVIFGIRTPQSVKDDLIQIVHDGKWFSSVRFMQAVQHPTEYRLYIEELSEQS